MGPPEMFPDSYNMSKWKIRLNFKDGWYFTNIVTESDKMNEERITLSLRKNCTYNVILHDKNDFVMNLNNVPSIDITKAFGYKSVYVKTKKFKMIRNCESSPSYSFKDCVEKYVIQVRYRIKVRDSKPTQIMFKSVGCKLGFQDEPLLDLPVCRGEDIIKYLKFYSIMREPFQLSIIYIYCIF